MHSNGMRRRNGALTHMHERIASRVAISQAEAETGQSLPDFQSQSPGVIYPGATMQDAQKHS